MDYRGRCVIIQLDLYCADFIRVFLIAATNKPRLKRNCQNSAGLIRFRRFIDYRSTMNRPHGDCVLGPEVQLTGTDSKEPFVAGIIENINRFCAREHL